VWKSTEIRKLKEIKGNQGRPDLRDLPRFTDLPIYRG